MRASGATIIVESHFRIVDGLDCSEVRSCYPSYQLDHTRIMHHDLSTYLTCIILCMVIHGSNAKTSLYKYFSVQGATGSGQLSIGLFRPNY